MQAQSPIRLYQPPTPQPKPPATARELSVEEKAARYDQFVNLRAAKLSTRRQIANLNRQLEKLDLEENKVLGVGYLVEVCSLCGMAHEGNGC